MTLIATYKEKDQAIYVFDTRITINKDGEKFFRDNSLKFIAVGNKFGVFMAGDVLLWKKVIEFMKMHIEKINYDDIDTQEGDFIQALVKDIEKLDFNIFKEAHGICFFLDEKRKRNKQFIIKLYAGKGCIVEEVKDKKVYIIGSIGKKDELANKISKNIEKFYGGIQSQCYRVSNLMRVNIIDHIKFNDEIGFEKNGISSIFLLGKLEYAYFKILGEESNGEIINIDKGRMKINFEIKKEKSNIYIEDKEKNQKNQLYNINQLTEETEGTRLNVNNWKIYN